MRNKNSRAFANIAMLEFIANKLGSLINDFVFLGGSATALFITDPLVPDIRSTIDVDCIVDVLSLLHYHDIEKQLTKKGFKKSLYDDVICRWYYDDVILDVMPTDEKILGFGNRWYKAGIKYASTHPLNESLVIRALTAPYLVATKFEAFKTRGKSDFFASHDFEDIVTILDGRDELIDEISQADEVLKRYLLETFRTIIQNHEFISALPGYFNDYGSLAKSRAEITLKRIENILSLDNAGL